MYKMNCSRCASAFCLAIIAFGARANAGQTPTALRCGVDQSQQAQRLFADPNGKNEWKEYRAINAMPELSNDGGAFARLWSGTDGNVLIRTDEPGEDFAGYTDYCFDRTGKLIQLRFELRTAWGWGYRTEGPASKGTLAPKMSEFFDTTTDAHVTRPQQADDIPAALKPRVYMKKSNLPFFRLLPT